MGRSSRPRRSIGAVWRCLPVPARGRCCAALEQYRTGWSQERSVPRGTAVGVLSIPEVLQKTQTALSGRAAKRNCTPVEGQSVFARFLMRVARGGERPQRGLESRLRRGAGPAGGGGVAGLHRRAGSALMLPTSGRRGFDPRIGSTSLERHRTMELVWIGRGARWQPKDGWLALYQRDRVPLLLDPPAPDAGFLEDPEERSSRHFERCFTRMLVERGATVFTVGLQGRAAPEASTRTRSPLRHAVGLGVVPGSSRTTPSRPLRDLRRKSAPRRRTGRRAASRVLAGGRWSRGT